MFPNWWPQMGANTIFIIVILGSPGSKLGSPHFSPDIYSFEQFYLIYFNMYTDIGDLGQQFCLKYSWLTITKKFILFAQVTYSLIWLLIYKGNNIIWVGHKVKADYFGAISKTFCIPENRETNKITNDEAKTKRSNCKKELKHSLGWHGTG